MNDDAVAHSSLHCKIQKYYATFTKAPGPTLAIFFGLGSLVIPIYYGLFDRLPSWAHLLIVPALILAVPIGSFWLGAYIALKALPPATYAEVLIAGRSVEECICALSQHVKQACVGWSAPLKSAEVTALTRDLERVADSKAPAKDKLDDYVELFGGRKSLVQSLIEQLRNTSNKQDVLLKRTKAMKYRTAKELGIPVFRLCDHIVQYSPDLHRNRAAKYLKNWEEMLQTYARLLQSADVDRFDALIKQNRRIKMEAMECIQFQEQLMERRRLHAYVHELASSDSTSTSLKMYARALEQIATEHRERKNNNFKAFDGNAEDPLYRNCEADFLFFFRKQRAHPGFDLNSALTRLCKLLPYKMHVYPQLLGRLSGGAGTIGDVRRILRNQIQVLEGLRKHFETLREHDKTSGTSVQVDPVFSPLDRIDPILAVTPDSKGDPPGEVMKTRLAALRQLPWYVTVSTARSRDEIIARFEELYEPVLKNSRGGDAFIVTHGYSKTVREVLKQGLADLHDKLHGKLGKQVSPQTVTGRMPYLYLLKTGPHERFDTLLLEHELSHEKNLRKFRHIASGGGHVLAGLLKPGDRVVFLIGAECFDRERRVVHPRGLEDLAELLRRMRAKGARCLTVVVAESYKHQTRPLTNTEFYDQHFDRVTLYENIDLILSDHLVLWDKRRFSSWQEVVRTLLKLP